MSRRKIHLYVVLLFALGLPIVAQTSGPIQYFYDDLGRLIKVIDQNGNASTYAYDAVGNLLSIARSTVSVNGGLAVLNFTPQQGPIGQAVTIQGQGFDTNPASDVVQFNGTVATVTAATSTTLTAIVPTGATTGAISVKVGTASATSDAKFTVSAGALTSIAISPTASSLRAGSQQQFIATGTYADGSQQNITSLVTWSSSSPAIASVSNLSGSQGLVIGTGGGSAVITATSSSSHGSTFLTVTPLASLAVTPANININIGSTQQFTATGTFPDGTTADLTSQASWISSDWSAIGVNPKGLATGLGDGSVSLCAAIGGASNCVNATGTPVLLSLRISSPNQTVPLAVFQQFSAIGSFNDGNTQDITSSVVWSSSNPAVATISNTSATHGLVSDIGQGTTTITATSGSINNSTQLTFTAPAPASLVVTPAVALLQQAGTTQLSASLVFTNGSTQDVTQSATWTTSDPTIATVGNGTSAGSVTAVGSGVTSIIAASGSFNNSATLTVNSANAPVLPRFAYALDGFAFITIYDVNPQNGQLRVSRLVPVEENSTSLTVDPADQFVYVNHAASNTVAVFSTNPSDGSLKEVAGSPFATGNNPQAIVATPSGKFVYVANTADNSISGFAVDRTSGVFTSVPGSPFLVGSSPKGIVVDSASKFIYVMNSNSNSISAFTIDAVSGELTEIAGSPFTTCNPAALTIDPNGKYLYAGGLQGQVQSSELRKPQLILTSGARFQNVASNCSVHVTSAALLRSGDMDGTFGRSVMMNASQSVTDVPVAMLQASSVSGPSIDVFSIDPVSGVLTETANAPFSVPLIPNSMTTDVSGAYLYAASIDSILGFSVNLSDGTINELPDSPYILDRGNGLATVDPSGHFLYSGSSVFNINATTGSLGSIISTFASRGVVAFSMSGGSSAVKYVPQFAYVVSNNGPTTNGSGSNNISAYSINPATGVLTALPSSPIAEGLSPEAISSDPSGRYVFVVNDCPDETCSPGNGSVSVYQRDSNSGTLMPIAGSPFVTGAHPDSVGADASGAYLYVTNRDRAELSAYTIDSVTGLLSPVSGTSSVGGSPYFAQGSNPSSLAIDPADETLYIAVDDCIGCGPNGGVSNFDLLLPGGQAFSLGAEPTGTSPASVAVHPSGNYLFVANSRSNNVSVIINPFSNLPAVAGSPFATGLGPISVAVDPLGRFVFIVNQLSETVSAYAIDQNSGKLTAISGSPFIVGSNPTSATVDISGNFLYVTNGGDGTISAFSIDPISGMLSPLAGSPFIVGASPVSIITTGKVE